MKTDSFERVLRQENYAENTIATYAYAVREYFSQYHNLNKNNLLEYREFLIGTHRPGTVNLRIQGLNKYLATIGKNELQLKGIKIQEESFLENIISDEQYNYLKDCLRKETDLRCYFAIRLMAATGARVSELLRMKVEHILAGFFDICSKGGKIRRVFIPKLLREETLRWLDRDSGYLFLNRKGEKITARGLANRLTYYARKYEIDTSVVHPHAFRHLYARKFLEHYHDIALLSDLLGHKNIATTRIYLRRSSTEQQRLIDQIVDW